MAAQIEFTSILESQFREELEELMFFNPQQGKTLSGINFAILEYGLPSLHERDGKLRVHVEGLPETQTLYAVDGSLERPVLAGVMVYARTAPENMVLLHIAVKEEYSHAGEHGESMLVLKLITQLRRISKKIKGVREITIQYSSAYKIPT